VKNFLLRWDITALSICARRVVYQGERYSETVLSRIDDGQVELVLTTESTSGGQGSLKALPAFTRSFRDVSLGTRPPQQLPTKAHNQIQHDCGCIR
jgi:hypothetical protein